MRQQSIIRRIFQVQDLRNRILFTLGALVFFRLGSVIPVPGVDPIVLSDYFTNRGAQGVNTYFDFFSGGAFSRFSVFMLGIVPYISMSIIMQLLLVSFPALKKVHELEGGRAQIQRYTRYGTVIICIFQSYLVTLYARQVPEAIVVPMWQYTATAVLCVTTGTMILLWLSEQINTRGIGNGASLFIFTGIVARIPAGVSALLQQIQSGGLNAVFIIIAIMIFIGVICLVIYEQQGQRQIPVRYARSHGVHQSFEKGTGTYIPFKINPSGIIPVIFASAILSFPYQVLSSLSIESALLRRAIQWLNPSSVLYLVIYVLLIVFFAYFYTQVTLNAGDLSKRILDNGGTVPGVKPEDTESYFQKVINRIVLPGALFLGFIAIMPNLVQMAFQFPDELSYVIGGTSLLIMVGVGLDTVNQVQTGLKMHQVNTAQNTVWGKDL